MRNVLSLCSYGIILVFVTSIAACGGGDGGGNGGSDNDGSGITDTQDGITLRVRLNSPENSTVKVTWSVSKATLSRGANDFAIQFFVGSGQQWAEQISTEEPTDKGIPIILGGVPASFCFRMIATTSGGGGTVLGSGMSGNKSPCI